MVFNTTETITTSCSFLLLLILFVSPIPSTLVAIFSVLILTTKPGYHVLKLIILVLVCHLDKLCDFLFQVTKLPVTTNKVSELFALINFIRLIHSTVPVCSTKSFRVGHCFHHNSLLRLHTAYQINLV